MNTFPKRFSLLSLFTLTLLFTVQLTPVFAADPYINLYFDSLQPLTIGRTVRLGIAIINTGRNPIRATSLQCTQQGTSLSASSISRLPNGDILAAGSTFSTEQYYRAVSAGTTTVTCVFKGTDTVTGSPVTLTGSGAGIEVLPNTGLSTEAYSSTNSANVGEIIALTVVYHNQSQKTFTMVDAECPQLGRGIGFVGKTQTQATLPPGQSGFVQFKLQGAFSGASGTFLCKVTALDTSTNTMVSVPAGTVDIVIR